MAEQSLPAVELEPPRAVFWRHVAVSVQGSRHEQRGDPCQDASKTVVTASGVLIAAVADGAGSAPRSQEGSTVAVRAATSYLKRSLAKPSPDQARLVDAVRGACFAARDAVARRAWRAGEPISAFHATLVCVAIDGNRAAVAHIGDSVAVIERPGGDIELIAAPEHGDYVNSTFFVTQLPLELERLHVHEIDGNITAVALTSDGLLEVAFRDPYGACEPIQGFFGPIFRRVRAETNISEIRVRVAGLLASPKIRAATTDDVTLAIAVRLPSQDAMDDARVIADPLPPVPEPAPVVVISDDGSEQ